MLRLVQAAWQAEGLYLKRSGRGYAVQASIGGLAAVFAALMLLMLHIAAFAALLPSTGPIWAALILCAVDLVAAVVLGLVARNPPRDAVADEALRLRRAAVSQLTDGASRALVLAPLMRSQTAKKGLIGAAVTALAIGLMTRR